MGEDTGMAAATGTDAVTVGVPGEAGPPALPTCRQPIPGESAAVPANTCCGLHLSAAHTAGPFLKFWGLERLGGPNVGQDRRFTSLDGTGNSQYPGAGASLQYMWVGTLLLVTKAPCSEVVVELQEADGTRRQLLEAEELDSYRDWQALRFKIRLPLAEEGVQVFYGVNVSGQELRPQSGDRYSFHIVGSSQTPHWGFYSCSGFTSDVAPKKREEVYLGLKPMWEDVLAVHTEKPLHLLVGGGDQLYCDDVWELPSLKRFLNLPFKTPELRDAKRQAAFSDDMRAEVDAYYFHHYCCHFGHEVLEEVYAKVPQIMTWDDHDIFDGWGSYPPYLQQSQVFQGIFECANRWYCIFQQHCRPSEKLMVSVYEVGSRTAIVACDQRHRRLRDQILPLEHYMELTELCTQLPKGTKHVIFVSTVPVVYPDILGARAILHMMRTRIMRWLAGNLGMNLMNAFGEPELMDDLDDHWCAPSHHDERRFLIEHLQMLAKYRGCRVSLLSGDVHVCGAGKLMSYPKPPKEQLKHDFRFMPQIISSAIANPPPPGGLLRVLNLFGGGGKINRSTRHSMHRVITNSVGVPKALENARNWCEVVEHVKDDGVLPGGITFRLRVEDSPGSKKPPRTYDIEVPRLEPLEKGTDKYYEVRSAPVLRRWLCC